MKRTWVWICGVWKAAGFYIAMTLFVLALGCAAYWMRGRGGGEAGNGLPLASAAPVTAEDPSVESLAEATRAEAAWAWPLAKARIVRAYSAQTPVWWDTLAQWALHDGVDLAAAAGEAVFAAMDGEVTRAYRSDLMGNVLEVTHEDGYVSVYASLGTTALVAVGERVYKGQAMAAAGVSAKSEAELGAHVHFEILRFGAPIDPETLCGATDGE